MSGIYIHIPFCKSKCPYCDFHSGVCRNSVKEKYVEAIIDEIKTLRRTRKFIPNGIENIDTLYLGGGTPSLLSGDELFEIISTAERCFNIQQGAEITVECNPGSPIEELIPCFKKCGVNRISLGMQSAVDKERKQLGRISDKKRIKDIICALKSNGINNISLDVMLGIPDQTLISLKETLDFCIECDVPHISAYILKIEEGTFFFRNKERYSFPNEDEVCDLYEFCCEYLEKSGFSHYEISNFAKPGFESRHNTKYWELENYLGIGAAAHSFIDGKRFCFPADTQGFIDSNEPVFDTFGGDFEEYIMLRLRLKEGLSLEKLTSLYSEVNIDNIKNKIPILEKQELIVFRDNIISLTTKGMLLSNYVIGEIIG